MERSQNVKQILLTTAFLFSASGYAQTPSSSDDSVSAHGDNTGGGLAYIGDSTRFSIGYDSEFDLYGEFLQVFGETSGSAWIGQGWVAKDAGGLQFNYHWLSGSAETDGNGHVNKIFAAVDQNEDDDRKFTLG
jgi:hypothetical protein